MHFILANHGSKHEPVRLLIYHARPSTYTPTSHLISLNYIGQSPLVMMTGPVQKELVPVLRDAQLHTVHQWA